MGVVFVAAATYALLLLGDAFLMGITWSWTALSLAFALACGLATPTALVLWERVVGPRGAGAIPGGPQVGGRRGISRAATEHNEREAERRLLEAIERRGEIKPTHAALETSLTVREADRMLSDLARGGYLEVRAEGRQLFYSL